MSQPLLVLDNASFGYDGQRLLFENASFQVNEGQLCCLFGPNGCGKTTMLDCIINLHKLNSGRILVLGRDVSQYKRYELAQHIAYVPQIHERAFPYTVKQVVMMGRTAYGGMFGKRAQQDEDLALQSIEKVGLSKLKDVPYTRLSGGELKLVMLARALVQQTKIIIMDEPASHLDFKNELLLLETIYNLVSEFKISVVMATHEPNHAFYFDSRGLPTKVVLLNEGRIESYDDPDAVLTEETLKRVYGINSKLLIYKDEYGCEHKSLTLLETINSSKERQYND